MLKLKIQKSNERFSLKDFAKISPQNSGHNCINKDLGQFCLLMPKEALLVILSMLLHFFEDQITFHMV